MLERLLRLTLSTLLKLLFRVEVRGLEHYRALAGKKAVIIANHQSFLDPLLLSVFIEPTPSFAMNVYQSEKWYFKPMLKLVNVFKVDPAQPMSTKSIISHVRNGGQVVIFPEGRITTTGGIMKVYDGTGMVVERSDAPVLPIRIEGAQYSILSRMQGKEKRRLFPKITLTFYPPRQLDLPDNLDAKARRESARQQLYDILCETAFNARDWRQPLLGAIAETAGRVGMGQKIATDITQAQVSYRSLFTRCFVLGEALRPSLTEQRYVGMLLPTSLAGAITFLALQLLGKVPAMLNYSAGARSIGQAAHTATLKTVITSRTFVEKGKLEEVMKTLEGQCRIIYLEDLKSQIGLKNKLKGLSKTFVLKRSLPPVLAAQSADEPAVILFTSGSEGAPKGVVLSHENILANVSQAAARLSFTSQDVMLNAMPIFHSFGLTAGTILPLALGFRVYFYPSPLHYKIVPEVAYDIGATILLGTDTFFNGYARYADPFDFHTVRLAVAGAEKLKESTRQLYAEKFHVTILEGYGVTETAPVVSANTPLECKPGSVGRLMPCMECKLEEVDGLDEGGRLYVKGPNVMLGYMKTDRPGELQAAEEWYDTGDIVDVDAQGFITILGRAKRFAKIGGEMVSLAVVEDAAASLWPETKHAAMTVADERKGEAIILITEQPDATREAFTAHARQQGMADIALPKKVEIIPEIPLLGSGKIDYMALKKKEDNADAA